MDDTIERLVEKIDSSTKRLGCEYPIQIVGSQDSRFLKGVKGRCKKLGLSYVEKPDIRSLGFGPAIVDEETTPDIGKSYLAPQSDVDSLMHDGLSSTAEAVLLYLMEQELIAGKHICIIGRGHSVKGLAEELLKRDATITVCHTKTESLATAAFPADIIINSAPGLEKDNAFMVSGVEIIDISGSLSVDENFSKSYLGSRDIGKLNISILLDRAAMRY